MEVLSSGITAHKHVPKILLKKDLTVVFWNPFQLYLVWNSMTFSASNSTPHSFLVQFGTLMIHCIGGSKGGARDAPPMGVPILSFSCSFRQKIENDSTFRSWRTPPGENPGSATALRTSWVWSIHTRLGMHWHGCFHKLDEITFSEDWTCDLYHSSLMLIQLSLIRHMLGMSEILT